MPADGEAGGGEVVDRREAAVELVDAAAGFALEVVVMRLAGALVKNSAAGEVDGCEPGLSDESADGAVDGSDAQAADVALGEVEGFEGGERPVGAVEGGADGVELAGVAGALNVFSSRTDRLHRDGLSWPTTY